MKNEAFKYEVSDQIKRLIRNQNEIMPNIEIEIPEQLLQDISNQSERLASS